MQHHHNRRSDAIATAPSQMSAAHAHRHPRRPPAHCSVSLLHSPTNKRSASRLMAHSSFRHSHQSQPPSRIPSSDCADLGSSPDSDQPTTSKKLSSGEVSDAGNWFDNENNNARHHNGFLDNDPPFFLRNESSSSTSPELRQAQSTLHPHSLPHRPALMPMATDGSSNEDFRSVIDDLTVENKKLKRKLRKYEKMHGHPARDERLFEIRIHGLPPHKKHELEETLRKFATTLDDGASSESANDASTTVPLMPVHPTMSSHTSTRIADSAYHSMSASGQNSTAPSGSDSLIRKPSRTVFKNQQDSIQSYLQDIPQGLLPRQPIAMTEKSKKKMVVRRLEQIFSGKGAVGGHHQPQQQQEVSQSAAHADRMELEATTGVQARKEGHREARIMSSKNEEQMETEPADKSPEARTQGATQHLDPSVEIAERDFADKESAQASDGNNTPDQRPTRPLDLDPQRAQVPEDNMKYIRHLGFSPPDIETEQAHADGHGWIYLNILINMAQLHTINVTPEFVQEALGEFSSKFELSKDGRKVRWSGGKGVSLQANDSSPDQAANSALRSNVKRIGQKRMRIGYSSNDDASSSAPMSDQLSRMRSMKSELSYTPLFYHREESDEYGSNMGPSSDYDSPPMQGNANSSALASSGMQTSTSKRRRDDGPIIFYNKARFCTDLSGDRDLHPSRNHTDYSTLMSTPLGATPDPDQENEKLKLMDSVRGPLVYAEPKTEQAMDLDAISTDAELQFPSSPSVDNAPCDREDVDFEVSGLGGVLPGDNFAINVECRQVRIDAPPLPGAMHAGKTPFPNKVTRPQAPSGPSFTSNAIIKPSSAPIRPVVNKEIISASRKNLPVSILPPPSLLPFDSSSGDADSDTDMSDCSDDDDSNSDIPAPGPQLVNLAGASSSDEEDDGFDEDDDEDDSDDDGSLDFLATAREIDPASIRAKEREYDSNMAERLAEEIPAGSSAATAGGGSGFNSPASVARENVEDARRLGLGDRKPGLKRARTSETMTVNGREDGDEEEDKN